MNMLLSVSSFFSYLGYIVIAIVVLLFMVLIHELGHYTAGKMLKFKINEFSVGFGPKIIQKKKKNGELISLRAFPLGGYCAFEGENEDNTANPQAFNSQKPWKRLIVLFFGAFFNLLSGIIFSFILLVSSGYDLMQVKTIESTSINYYDETTDTGFKVGDVLLGVEGEHVNFVNDVYFQDLITKAISNNEDLNTLTSDETDFTTIEIEGKSYNMQLNSLNYNVRREGEEQTIIGRINIIYNTESGAYVGWALTSDYDGTNENEFVVGTYRYSFFEALTQAVPFACKWAWKILVIFGRLITGRLSLSALGGPVTTINMIATYTSMSASYLLTLLPVIAINLAVFNLLPIPALDGCQMLFVLIEWIRRKPISPKVTNAINNFGLIVLLGFVIIVDILQFL